MRLSLPDLRPEDAGATVRVTLRDTTMEDALHPTVAETTAILEGERDTAEVVMTVPSHALDPRHRYSVWVQVDHEGSGGVTPGDLITTQNVPITPDDLGASVIEVPLTRV